MSVEHIEDQIRRLPRVELARLVGWLDRFLGRASVGEQFNRQGNLFIA